MPIQNGLNQGDALSPPIFKSLLEYTTKVQENQEGLPMTRTYQLLIYADVGLWVGTQIPQEDMQKLNASKEAGLEVNKEKTRYMLMPQCQNTGHHCNTTIVHRYLQDMALGTTTNKSNRHS
jgi:hypothetical protein